MKIAKGQHCIVKSELSFTNYENKNSIRSMNEKHVRVLVSEFLSMGENFFFHVSMWLRNEAFACVYQ